MKIAMILSQAMRERLFSEKAMERLRNFGEVIVNETNDTSPEQVKKVIAGADIAITSWGSQPIDEEILAVAPELKLVVHAAGSVKPIVSDALWEKGIRVTGSPKPLGEGVAETALGLSIAASKNVFALSKNIAAGGWAEGKDDIKELFDITVGVVGAGWAGKHYIRLMKNFGVEILMYDPFIPAETAHALGAEKVEFEDLLRRSDIVSIHAPSIPETYHMFNAETLALMKKDAILINTARGSILDEKALYAHMTAGNLKYACLDVTDPEPPAKDHPLRTLPNVIFTPHLAGLVNNGQRRIGIHTGNEIAKFLEGSRMDCEVTKEMLKTMA